MPAAKKTKPMKEAVLFGILRAKTAWEKKKKVRSASSPYHSKQLKLSYKDGEAVSVFKSLKVGTLTQRTYFNTVKKPHTIFSDGEWKEDTMEQTLLQAC